MYLYTIIRVDPKGKSLTVELEIEEEFYSRLPDMDFMVFKTLAAKFTMMLDDNTPKMTEAEIQKMLIEMIEK